MANTADIAFLYQQAIDEFTHLGFTSVVNITPTGTTWGIQGTRGGITSGLKFISPQPVDAEVFYQTIKAAGFHEDYGLLPGYERLFPGASATPAVIPGPNVASANIVALLRMDGTGASFVDSGPNALTVTAAGSATQVTVAGAYGKALNLDTHSTANHIDIAANARFALPTFSINLRILLGATTTQSFLILDIDGFSSGISIRGNQGATDRLSLYLFGTVTHYALAWAANTWYEIEISRNAADSNLVDIFIQGVKQTSTSDATAFAATPALRIGTPLAGAVYNNVSTRAFDDVLITNNVLHSATYTPRAGAYVIV